MTRRVPETDYNPGGAPFTGRKMLIVMLAFFGVVIAVNVTMAVIAVGSFRGVIVESGYVASQDFNRDTALLAAQAERGWAVEPSAAGGAPMIAFRDAEGRPVEGLTVSAVALWRTDEHDDVALTMVEAAPGLFAAEEALRPGQWRLSVRAEGAGEPWAGVFDLFVRPGS
jgi:nitrogen fixation protein FixH